MQRMTLQEIAEAVDGKLNHDSKLSVDEISTDTRKISPGCLYLALSGERFDGHDFIEKAFEAGALVAISSREMKTEHPVILVEDTRLALGRLAAYYKEKHSLFTVGVTGSVGKTSTKEMIAAVLSRKYRVHKTQGNFNNDIGLPMTLLGIEPAHTAAVIEMGMSALGEISYLSKLAQPDLAVITNIGVSHLENLGTRENILKAKLEILDGMKPDGKIVLNGDNDMLKTLEEAELLKDRAVWFGLEARQGMVWAENVLEENDSTYFTFVYQGKRYPAVLPAIGIHNVYNALAGFCVGILSGIAPEEIVEAVKGYQNAGMRQSIQEYDGIKVIADCYNASPDSMRSALDVIRKVECGGKRFAVLGDMLELGPKSAELHFEVGRLAAQAGLNGLICCGEQSAEIARGAEEHGLKTVFHTVRKAEAAEWLQENLRKGDAVIFKASRGMKLEELITTVFGKAGGSIK